MVQTSQNLINLTRHFGFSLKASECRNTVAWPPSPRVAETTACVRSSDIGLCWDEDAVDKVKAILGSNNTSMETVHETLRSKGRKNLCKGMGGASSTP